MVGVFSYFHEESEVDSIGETASGYAELLLEGIELSDMLASETEAEPDSPIKFMNAPIAVIEIPKFGVKRIVAEGFEPKVLDDPATGVGKLAQSVPFGNQGNINLAAHRRANGGAFLQNDKLVPGDAIIIHDTQTNLSFEYQVTSVFVVEPKDTWVLHSKVGKAEITLIACHPVGVFNQRLIVKAELVKPLTN